MGQSLDTMQPQQSKGELLYELVVSSGDLGAIRALCREGADLEWIDRKGKTSLIVACMNPRTLDVAKTLIDLGANVNVYRPGRHAGTPLHHAAKRGLEETVKLLLSRGANALVRNDDCQTPLDASRMKGHVNVVRAIENHISYFSGWLRESYGPGFLEALAPQLLSRKVWVVVIPCGSSNPSKTLKMELVIYSTLQDAQPRTVIALWKSKIEEPKFHLSDPALTIFDQSTKTRFRLASANEGDKRQIQLVYNACRGIPQVRPSPVSHESQASCPETSEETAAEAAELAFSLNASIQSVIQDRPHLSNAHQNSQTINTNGWGNLTDTAGNNGWGQNVISTHTEASTSSWSDERVEDNYIRWGMPDSSPVQTQPNEGIPASVSSTPSAPPFPNETLDLPINYPSIDCSPVAWSAPALHSEPSTKDEAKDGDRDRDGSSSCVICWEAPIEGACIPCGHMAGCMSCLNAIKSKKGPCPVCRSKIDKVIRLYAV